MTTLAQRLHGIVPPVCTPLTESQEIDLPSLERLITFLLDAGVHGLFLLGSTSEGAILTAAQRSEVLDTGVRISSGKVPVLAGVIDTSTDRVIEQARAAERAGVDGLVVTAPFYIQPSQDEIIAHFRTVRAATDLPILAYDIPSAVQTKLERSTVVRLAEDGIIAGLKDSSGDEANFRGVVMATRQLPHFAVFTGSELLVDAAVAIGARGSVPGLGNVDPAGYVRLYDAARRGDWDAARVEQDRLYRLFSIIEPGMGRMGFTASAIGGFKTALMLRGVIATNVLARPMPRYKAEEIEQVRRVLVETGLLPAN
ncbi:MAG: dihydrodipicolinate synthase family protein [Chloroflexota bacterium]